MRFGVLFLAIGLFSGAVQAAPSQADLKKIERQIAIEEQNSRENQKKSAEIKSEIKQVQRQMVVSARNIQQHEDMLSGLEKQLADLNVKTADLEAKLGLKDAQMVQVVTGLQTLALRPKELVLLTPKNPIDMVRSHALMYASVPVIGMESEQLKKDLQRLNQLKSETIQKTEQIKQTTQRLTEQTEQMDRLVKQKSLLQAQYDAQYDQARKKAQQLASQAKDLKELLEQLELERQRQQAERLKQAYLTSPRHRPSAGTPSFVSSAVSGSFERSYGSLLYPVRGQIIAKFGDTLPNGTPSKGLMIQTRERAQVIAPFDGTVLFAGPFKGYGQLLILDHNNGYFSLLAGMQDIHVSMGQELLAGEPVGLMKPVRSNLYIEIRKDGTAIDPKPWFIPVI